MTETKVVAFGGGHGLAATLRALRMLPIDITAIVTVADNGGSSGRLRKEFKSLPPGDLRMALAALCADDEWGRSWADLMQYRFTSHGELNGHAIGNLILSALWDREIDPVKGLEKVGELLKVVGRVLPMSNEPLDIEGTFRTWQGMQVVRGQKEVAIAKGSLEDLQLLPDSAMPTTEGIQAIADADWLIFGPGSWFSSVLPHFLLSSQREAIYKSTARKILVLNLDANSNVSGDELAGTSPADHLKVLRKFAPQLTCDFALADHSITTSQGAFQELSAILKEMGGTLIVSDLATNPGSNQHDHEKLFSEFRNIIASEVIR